MCVVSQRLAEVLFSLPVVCPRTSSCLRTVPRNLCVALESTIHRRMMSEKSASDDALDIASSTAPSIHPGLTSISQLLGEATKASASSCTVFKTSPHTSCVFVCTPIPAREGQCLTLSEAVDQFKGSLQRDLTSPSYFTYQADQRDAHIFFAILTPLPEVLSLGLSHARPPYDRVSTDGSEGSCQSFASRGVYLESPGASSSFVSITVRKYTTYILATLAILIFGAMMIKSLDRHPSGAQIQYQVGDSVGPKYTALLHPENVTAWAEKHYNPEDWYIRIDDQALIPIELMDEQEWRYQEYLSNRYPEKAEMRDSGAWRDVNFLKDPNNFMFPTDKQFHRGHCVRAIRRYWQAKETGRHVCAFDIDYLHLKHCFNMLEELIYVPGPREEVPGEMLSMSWRAKVCMWEP